MPRSWRAASWRLPLAPRQGQGTGFPGWPPLPCRSSQNPGQDQHQPRQIVAAPPCAWARWCHDGQWGRSCAFAGRAPRRGTGQNLAAPPAPAALAPPPPWPRPVGPESRYFAPLPGLPPPARSAPPPCRRAMAGGRMSPHHRHPGDAPALPPASGHAAAARNRRDQGAPGAKQGRAAQRMKQVVSPQAWQWREFCRHSEYAWHWC